MYVWNNTSGIPDSSAEVWRTYHHQKQHRSPVGLWKTKVLSLSQWSKLRNGTKRFFAMDSQTEGMSRSESSVCRRPSGVASNWKSSKPSREWEPLDLSSRLWLYSVLTKVIWKPLKCRQTAWGLSATSLKSTTPQQPPPQCECETMQLFGRERDVATFIGNFERMALRNVSSAEQKPISWCWSRRPNAMYS